MQYPNRWLQGATLGQKICCELRLNIVEGAITPGTMLTENQIASEFSTSRAPVREAFKVLANEGLIRLERMGAVILGLTTKDIDELYDVRFLIESFAVDRILNELNESKIVKLHQMVEKMELAAMQDDHVEFSYYDIQLHESLIILANHTRMLHLWNNIRYIVEAFLLVATKKRFSENKDQVTDLIEKHKSLIRAIKSKDQNLTQKAIQENYYDTRKTVIKAYFNQ